MVLLKHIVFCMKTYLLTWMRRLQNACNGYVLAHKREKQPVMNFVLLGIGIFFVYVCWPLREIEALLLLFSCVLIVVSELHNSALEAALNRLHPELHDEIKASKDIAAAATLTAALFALGVTIWILYAHFYA